MPCKYIEAIENSNIVSKTDIEGIITFASAEFCKIFGFTQEELVGKNHNIVRHPDVHASNFETLWQVIKGEKQTYKTTLKNLTKDGRTIYLNTTIIPILDENDNIEEFVAIRYDVTSAVELKKNLELKDQELNILNETLEQRVQEQTKQLQELNQTLEQRVLLEIKKNEKKQKLLFWQSRMASLGQMLGNIAHQWRQPLTELNLTLFNINKASEGRDCKKVSEYYEEGKFIIKNMSKTIDDFTNFFDPNKKTEKFLLKNAINEALEILKKMILKDNISIQTDYGNIYVVGISNELSQVMINLIKNAYEAFNSREIKNKHIIIKTYIQEKNIAIIEISDNAGGIKPKHIDHIFEPYFTTKHATAGTGLGLFMSKMIIEKSLHGSIEAKNVNKGITIKIAIPL